MNLKDRWALLVEATHFDWTWRMIETLYGEPHRAYHNLRHIEACFRVFEQLRRSEDFRESEKAVDLAIFFHDIVYVPGDKRNEEISAGLLQIVRNIGTCSQSDVQHASVAILATKSHETVADNIVSQIMIDVDLSVLGGTGGEYALFVSRVRQEYAQVSNEAWRLGRATFLTKMLERKVIFQTPWAINTYEENARQNMKLELMELIRP